MEIRQTIPDTSWPRLSELFEEVGWGQRPPEEVRAAFGNSTFRRFAFEGDEIIGFGRTVDDGRYYGLIVDLEWLRIFKDKESGHVFLPNSAIA